MARIEIRKRFGDFKPQFPLLEQMRAQRDERERGAKEALSLAYAAQGDMLRSAWDQIRQLVNTGTALRKMLTTSMWDSIKDKIELDLSRALRRAIHEAVNTAAARHPEFDRYFVEIKIPADLRDLHPQSIEHAILEKFMTQYSLELDLYEDLRAPSPHDGEPVRETKIMHRLEVRVPPVSYTHIIEDLHKQAERGFRD